MTEIIEYENQICARFDPGLGRRVSQLNIGRWKPQWKCWIFPRTPNVAHTLLSLFTTKHVDDQIKELANAFHEAQQYKIAEDLPNIPNLKTNAWLHQRRAYYFAQNMPGVILDYFMGTGKTCVAVGLIANRESKKNLILCPKSVIAVWPAEFQKHSQVKFHVVPLTKGSTKEKELYAASQMKLAQARKESCVIVVNYETFWREPLITWIMKQEWDNLILDEIHKIKAVTGQASRNAAKVAKKATYKMGLTGTLLPHSPLDAFGQCRTIDPSIFGTSYHRFKTKYAVLYGPNNNFIDYSKLRNEEEFKEKLSHIAIRAGKEVLDLPEQIHTFRSCELSAKQRDIYNKLDRQLYAEIQAGMDEDGRPMTPANAMVKVLRLQQLTSGYAVVDDGETIQVGSGKQELLKELLEELPQDEPVVIFARFRPDVGNIHKVAGKLGRTSSELSGRVNELKEWQDGKTNALAVNIQSGGVGIDLTRTRYVIYYSIGHSNGDYQQSLSRIHRPGQTRAVVYYHLICENTVDVTVYQALQTKQEVIERILSGQRDQLNDIADL